MITRLNDIKGFGIFETFHFEDGVSPFAKYNIIYGWNGSGKTTLGRLFRTLELPKEKKFFPKAQFKIETDNGSITEAFETEPPAIKVFNKDFINDNTNLERGKTNALLYIGKDNNELKKAIDELTQQLSGADGKGGKKLELHNEKEKLKGFKKSKEDFFTNAGQLIKTYSLSTIFPLPNFDKNGAEQTWNEIKSGTSLQDFVLLQQDEEHKKSFIAQGVKRTAFKSNFRNIESEQCENHFNSVRKLLEENPVNNSIQRLKDNPDLAAWVQHGIKLHEKHNSLKCEYCGNGIESQREGALADHFNDAFIQFQNRINEKIAELKSFQLSPITINHENWFPELKEKSIELHQFAEQKRSEINDEISRWITSLEEKHSNPLKSSFQVSSIGSAETVNLYNHYIDELKKNITTHNQLVNDFDSKANEYRTSIFRHIIASKAILESLNDTILSIEQSNTKIKGIDASIASITKEIEEKRRQLLDDQIAIDDINKDLHKFLSRNDITLEKNSSGEGGYLIKRKDSIAENLSEGEKTAIALVYFMAKLFEKGNDIKKNILVFDDPISSFDSNHLFSACAYITNKCEQAEQIFFLTHNFWFFKLVRDWANRKNEKKKRDNDTLVGHFYTIRKGVLKNAENTLVSYHSEYHYIFDSLLKLSKQTLTLEDAYTIANYSRRLLESFNSFKTQDTSGFNGILQMANGVGIDKLDTDKVFYYVNKYSHLDRIESFENTLENIEAEGVSVIETVFKIIEKVDDTHYKNMVKVCLK